MLRRLDLGYAGNPKRCKRLRFAALLTVQPTLGGFTPVLKAIRPLGSLVRNLNEMVPVLTASHGGRTWKEKRKTTEKNEKDLIDSVLGAIFQRVRGCRVENCTLPHVALINRPQCAIKEVHSISWKLRKALDPPHPTKPPPTLIPHPLRSLLSLDSHCTKDTFSEGRFRSITVAIFKLKRS